MLVRCGIWSPLGALLVLLLSLPTTRTARTEFAVTENSETGHLVGTIVEDEENSPYSFDNNCGTYFNIHPNGSITVKDRALLDREAMANLNDNRLDCIVGLNSGGTRSISIEVKDINDEKPRFSDLSQPYVRNLTENTNVGSIVLTLQPVDHDNGANGTTQFNITAGNDLGYFELRVPETKDESTPERDLFIIRDLDYDEVGSSITLNITIRDMGSPPQMFVQTITFLIINLQDSAPRFAMTTFSFSIPEDYLVGPSHVFNNVTVSEALQNIRYSLMSSNNPSVLDFIAINNRTGELYLKRKVDYEIPAQRLLQFVVMATNTINHLQHQAVVRVTVVDVDNEPLYFACERYKPVCPSEVNNTVFSITENIMDVFLILRELMDTPFSVASFTTIPEGAPIQYKQLFLNTLFIDTNFTDREAFPYINVEIQARKMEPPFKETFIVFGVRVLDVNDNSPVFTSSNYEAVLFEGSPIGRNIIQVEATDADAGENGTVTYSITSVEKEQARSWFTIDRDTGVISVATSFSYPVVDGLVSLTVTARDHGNTSMSSSVTVTIRIVQATSFSRNSYQEYSNQAVDLLGKMNQDVYLEVFLWYNGLLLYQQDESGTSFSIHYSGGHIVAALGESSRNASVDPTMLGDWIGIRVKTILQQISDLSVAAVDLSEPDTSNPLLHNITVQSCQREGSENNSMTIENHHLSFFIGGVNMFNLLGNSSHPPTTFTGAIRNVVVGGAQLDLSCPHEQVNTKQGVVNHFKKCKETGLRCSSHSAGCVDFISEQPYCQCAGGFPVQACNAVLQQDEDASYAPIRFTGTSGVQLSLEYGFFAELQSSTSNADTSDERNSRKKRDVGTGDVKQTIEVKFRALDVQNSIILSSQTSSSRHSIEILESSDGLSFLQYRIWSLDSENTTTAQLRASVAENTLYHLRVILSKKQIDLEMSGGSDVTSATTKWESDDFPEVPMLAEQPVTSLTIGSSLQPDPASYFMGCITRIAIDNIDIPLNGLLQANGTDGGFEISSADGVISHCNLCHLSDCPPKSACLPLLEGGVSCPCNSLYVTRNGSCELQSAGITPRLHNSDMYYIIAGCALASVVLFGLCILTVIVICRKRQEKKKERRYAVNNIGRINRSRRDNDYSPSILKKSSFSSSMNANHTVDTHELRSSISTYQEHAEDGDPDANSPVHNNTHARRKSCASMESGIKMDDREMGGMPARGIPTMDDSGHEVNSTDSNRSSSESDEVASSCYDPMSLRGPHITSPDHSIPRTPLTPKEKKIMIPLRPPSTNLSQSEYDDEEEAIETESFHTRISSSSGMGNSMQNQGRGSDTDSSKISDSSRWYLPPSSLDKERSKFNLQTLRAPYHQPHHEDGVPGSTRQYPPDIPPMYHSPPSFSEHVDRSYPRGRSKSHSGKSSMSSPIQPGLNGDNTASPQRRRYENYPEDFRESRPNGVMYKENGMRYGTGQFLERDMNPRISNKHNYTPSSLFTRQYSDPKIPRNGTYCIPRNRDEPWPVHNRQISDPQQSSQESSAAVFPRGAHSTRHLTVYPSNSTTTTSTTISSSSIRQPPTNRQYYTLGHNGKHKHVNFAPTTRTVNQQAARSFSSGDSKGAGTTRNEPYQTLNSLSKIDPISNWDAQDRMKETVDHMDPCHLLSGPCIPFEYVSTDPSVVEESQLTLDESVMGTGISHQVFDSENADEEGAIPNLLDPLDINMVRLGEDEIDSILTDSEVGGGRQIMNHFPSADCSSQYTTTIVAGSTSTSGESTPKVEKVFVFPPSQQSFDV